MEKHIWLANFCLVLGGTVLTSDQTALAVGYSINATFNKPYKGNVNRTHSSIFIYRDYEQVSPLFTLSDVIYRIWNSLRYKLRLSVYRWNKRDLFFLIAHMLAILFSNHLLVLCSFSNLIHIRVHIQYCS